MASLNAARDLHVVIGGGSRAARTPRPRHDPIRRATTPRRPRRSPSPSPIARGPAARGTSTTGAEVTGQPLREFVLQRGGGEPFRPPVPGIAVNVTFRRGTTREVHDGSRRAVRSPSPHRAQMCGPNGLPGARKRPWGERPEPSHRLDGGPVATRRTPIRRFLPRNLSRWGQVTRVPQAPAWVRRINAVW